MSLDSKKHAAPERDDAGKSGSERHLWDMAAVRELFWIGLAAFLVWFGYEVRGVFTPVLVALLLAYLVNPLVGGAVCRWHIPRRSPLGRYS
jgi:predicted PurR-regulated permease PerM